MGLSVNKHELLLKLRARPTFFPSSLRLCGNGGGPANCRGSTIISAGRYSGDYEAATGPVCLRMDLRLLGSELLREGRISYAERSFFNAPDRTLALQTKQGERDTLLTEIVASGLHIQLLLDGQGHLSPLDSSPFKCSIVRAHTVSGARKKTATQLPPPPF